MVSGHLLFYLPRQGLLFGSLERVDMSFAFLDCPDARIRPFAGLPASRRTGKPNRALAARRCGLRVPAATPGRHAVEHRRRTARECDSLPRAFNHLVAGTFSQLDGNLSECLPLRDDALVYERCIARFQPAANLSARRRTNFALPALVYVWTGAQSDDCNRHRLCGHCRFHSHSHHGQSFVVLPLGWIRPDELLERFDAGARLGTRGQNAEA